mgnify:CR=1 FL=1
MNLSETIKTNNDLTFLQGQVMMILEQELSIVNKNKKERLKNDSDL